MQCSSIESTHFNYLVTWHISMCVTGHFKNSATLRIAHFAEQVLLSQCFRNFTHRVHSNANEQHSTLNFVRRVCFGSQQMSENTIMITFGSCETSFLPQIWLVWSVYVLLCASPCNAKETQIQVIHLSSFLFRNFVFVRPVRYDQMFTCTNLCVGLFVFKRWHRYCSLFSLFLCLSFAFVISPKPFILPKPTQISFSAPDGLCIPIFGFFFVQKN